MSIPAWLNTHKTFIKEFFSKCAKKTPICLRTEDFLLPPCHAWLSLNANLVIHFSLAADYRGALKKIEKKIEPENLVAKNYGCLTLGLSFVLIWAVNQDGFDVAEQRFLNSVCLPIVVCSTRIHFITDKGKEKRWRTNVQT